MKYVVKMNTPLMSHLHLRELVEERRKVRVRWLKSSNSLNVMQNKIYSARVIDLDYQIEVFGKPFELLPDLENLADGLPHRVRVDGVDYIARVSNLGGLLERPNPLRSGAITWNCSE